MAPCNPTSRANARSSADIVSEDRTESQETMANQQAEIERLTALLYTVEARVVYIEGTPSIEQIMTMLTKGIVQALDKSRTSLESIKRLAKIPSLATLIDS